MNERLTEAQAALVADHLPLARKLAAAAWTKTGSDSFDDFLSDAHLGLIQAARRYDGTHDAGASFGTFAANRIVGAIADGRRSRDPISRTDRTRLNKITTARYRFAAREQRFPSAVELAGVLGITPDDLADTVAAWQRADFPVSLDERLFPEAPTVAEMVPDPRVDAEFDAVGRRDVMEDLVLTLPPRERFVIGLYYWQGCGVREIGDVMGVTEARVSQIMSQAKKRLRERASRELLDEIAA